MEQKPIKFISITGWLLTIVVINGIFLMVSFLAVSTGNFWVGLWTYLESDVFKLVTGSLMIPLLFSILEKRYKFMENIQKQREDRRKQIEEQMRNTRQEAINDTLKMWQDLYNMISEVIYLDPKKNNKDEYLPVILNLTNFSSSAEHIVNKWTHQFPNLSWDDQDVFLYFINLLYQSGLTAAYYIHEEQDEKEVVAIQDTLFQIQDQIKTIANHTIANTLKYAAHYLELEETGEDPKESKRLAELIRSQMEILVNWRSSIKTLDDRHDNFLSTGSGPQIDELRQTAKTIEKWLRENKSRMIYQHPDFHTLEEQFYAIPMEERVKFLRIPFTRQYLKALADWLSFEAACNYIYSKGQEK